MAAMPKQSVTRGRPRGDFADLTIALACGLAAAATVLFLAALTFVRPLATSRDYIVYWATGQQLAHHANPYDAAAMAAVEHAAGFGMKGSYYMRNPPWSLPLTLPLGYAGAQAGALPWSLLMLALEVLAVRMVWQMYGRPGQHLEYLGYLFPPALVCVVTGQTSIFTVVGLALFLRLHRTHGFWAGAALWLCTLKPHLFVPFGVVLLAWILVQRKYRVLGGAAAAMAASCAITALIDPHAWTQYARWAHQSGIGNEFIPCLSVALRQAIDPRATWIAFVPCAAAAVWALVYYWPRRARWDWVQDGNLVMMVSLLAAPYCWIWDQALAMPALLYAVCQTPSRKVIAALALLYLVLETQPFYATALNSPVYVWAVPAWFVWYLAARHSARGTVAASPAAARA